VRSTTIKQLASMCPGVNASHFATAPLDISAGIVPVLKKNLLLQKMKIVCSTLTAKKTNIAIDSRELAWEFAPDSAGSTPTASLATTTPSAAASLDTMVIQMLDVPSIDLRQILVFLHPVVPKQFANLTMEIPSVLVQKEKLETPLSDASKMVRNVEEISADQTLAVE
jgi:hypothetical protein